MAAYYSYACLLLGGSILFIAHGVNLDSCTRQLVGQQPRSQARFHEILHKIPYCAMSVAQEATVVRDTWYLIEPPVLPFAHTNNPKYNWTLLTTPGLVWFILYPVRYLYLKNLNYGNLIVAFHCLFVWGFRWYRVRTDWLFKSILCMSDTSTGDE